VNDDLPQVADVVRMIAGSTMDWELAVRLGQSLEITDGLWELVPIVNASGEAADERPAAEQADMSSAAHGLDDETRVRVRAWETCTSPLLTRRWRSSHSTRLSSRDLILPT
jgi:hypothetical protein